MVSGGNEKNIFQENVVATFLSGHLKTPFVWQQENDENVDNLMQQSVLYMSKMP